jgi:hypothetical protein
MLETHHKWDVFFKFVQTTIALTTLYLAYNTYNKNKEKDRETEIINRCESEIFIPISLPQSIDKLMKERSEESYHAYVNEIYSASLSDFVTSNSLERYAQKARKLQPSLKNKNIEIQNFLNKNKITKSEFKPFIINQIKKIQREAIKECTEIRIHALRMTTK